MPKTKLAPHKKLARKLLIFYSKNGWCKGAWAKKRNNQPCETSNSKAVRFCLTGARFKLPGKPIPNTTWSALTTALNKSEATGWLPLTEMNDQYFKNKAHVLRALKVVAK